jgi:predicted RNA-binding protein YlxR (DUF448 family)
MLAGPHDSETDTGPKRLGPGTERLCVATRVVRPVADLIRFVVGPDGDVVPDLKRKLPGRGLWITASRAAVVEAVRRKAFARGFRRDVRVPSGLAAMVEERLERSAFDALSIAHKAGLVPTGFAKVQAALAGEPVVALVHAADAGADGVRKLAAAVTRRFGDEAGRVPVIAAFTSMQLDLALGRSNVIHAALLAGSASGTFLARCRSLEHYRTAEPDGPGIMARS